VEPSPAALDLLVRLADDPAPPVRLAVASTLQRLPLSRRAAVAARLAAHVGDADDHNLPSMVWYGLIPLADADPQGLVEVWMATRWPSLRQSIVRRLGEAGLAQEDGATRRGLGLLVSAATAADAAARLALLEGLAAALNGRRDLAAPAGWDLLHAAARGDGNAAADLASAIAVRFGDARAGADLVAVACADGVATGRRAAALAALVAGRGAGYQDVCRRLITVPGCAAAASAGLLVEGAEADARLACDALRQSSGDDRAALLAALAARASWATVLIDAVEAGRLPGEAIDPLTARSIAGLGAAGLTGRLARLGGAAADRPAKQRQISDWRERLTPAVLAGADGAAGREVWTRQCAGCHRLHGVGGTLGPDLTGAGRRDLDYLLGNIVDPSAVVTADYRLRQVLLDDGRVLAGIVVRRTPAAVTLRMPVGEVVLDAAEVEAVHDTKMSIMPEGLLDGLGADAVRDLVAYLMAAEPPSVTPPGR
jgi:putative heme-binding domain-containing protein